MDRQPGKRFSKQGARAARVMVRDLTDAADKACEVYVRERLKPRLVAATRAATAGFKRQNGR